MAFIEGFLLSTRLEERGINNQVSCCSARIVIQVDVNVLLLLADIIDLLMSRFSWLG